MGRLAFVGGLVVAIALACTQCTSRIRAKALSRHTACACTYGSECLLPLTAICEHLEVLQTVRCIVESMVAAESESAKPAGCKQVT